MIKSLVRKYVGQQVWTKLAEARQEFRIRNQTLYMDAALYEVISPLLPKIGYYIDIGAHDGRSYSNTYHLEKAGWKGILIEPILPTFFKLRQLRSLDSNIFVNAACVAFDYKSPNVLMSYGDLMSFAPDISSLDSSEWKSGSQSFLNRNELVVDTWAPAITLNQILVKSESPRSINFLSIDVEGSELEVLKGIDFDTYSFELICLETYTPDAIMEFMATVGYHSVAFTAHNLILMKNNF